MARIRTIKPEFFTSDDVCALSLAARLLFIACWCEADREGRLEFKAKTLKRKYLPEDDCDGEALAAELVNQGLIVLYGQGLAYIPTFAKHQLINSHEAKSKLPNPNECTEMHVHVDALPETHVGKGREGKGREEEGKVRIPPAPSGAFPPLKNEGDGNEQPDDRRVEPRPLPEGERYGPAGMGEGDAVVHDRCGAGVAAERRDVPALPASLGAVPVVDPDAIEPSATPDLDLTIPAFLRRTARDKTIAEALESGLIPRRSEHAEKPEPEGAVELVDGTSAAEILGDELLAADGGGAGSPGRDGKTGRAFARKSQLPKSWAATPEQLAYAAEQGCADTAKTALEFSEFYWSSGTRWQDWNLVFKRWCRNQKKYDPRGTGPPETWRDKQIREGEAAIDKALQ